MPANKNVTKRVLVERLREQLPLSFETERIALVETMIAAMCEALASGRRIEIRGFGVFELRRRGPRHAVNPRTGEPMFVPAKVVPFFRAGRVLLARVNK
jgi:integration host factor subunit beta